MENKDLNCLKGGFLLPLLAETNVNAKDLW